jgi:hypothetical protein
MLLSQTVQARADRELEVGRLDLAAALADEAREHALAAADAWEVAQATTVRALAASTIDELREGVDTAVALLEAVGNVYERFELLASAAHVALRLGDDEEAKRFVGRTAAAQGFDTYIWVLLRGNAGVAELLTGDPAAAADAFREQLALCREMEVLPLACQGLVGLAAVAALHGDSDRAARLFGAAAAHRYGQPYDELDARLDAAFFEEARARCGAEAWDAVVEEGRALSLADATAYALELSAAGIGVAPERA